MTRLRKLQIDIATWSDATFGENRTALPMLYHLTKEVDELIVAISENSIRFNGDTKKYLDLINRINLEYADCLMLLLDSAAHLGISSDYILLHCEEKLEINKARKWGKPDDNGVVEHIKE